MLKHLVPIALGTLFIALFAQLTLHLPAQMGRIPITGQTLAVLTVSLLLPPEQGVTATVLYVLLGAMGLPIYADGGSGWGTLAGGSGGFLLGFILAALLMGWLHRRGWQLNFGKTLIAMLLGTLVIIICGVFRLSTLYGFEKALEYGFYPFWRGAVVKILLGAMLVMIPVWVKESKEET